ncbi:MAG: hypothetical protein RR860_09860, partial [Janthinobacterium sp.]
ALAKIDPLLNTRLYTRQSKPFKQTACQPFQALFPARLPLESAAGADAMSARTNSDQNARR